MSYINYNTLSQISSSEFFNAEGFPWINPKGILSDESYEKLLSNLPDLSLFEVSKDIKRPHGQKPHDRLYLQYEDELNIPTQWQDFIDELRGNKYKAFVKRLYKLKWYEDIDLYFHWHYAENSNSVSPHTDGTAKLGSHLFYLNTQDDWKEEWGGQTLALIDQNNKFTYNSAPDFEDFDKIITANCLVPYTFIFARTNTSWHGVKDIKAPEGKYRKVFIVVIEKRTIKDRIKHMIFGKPKRVGY